MDGPQMLVERLQRATNDHDVDAVVACFAEDYENETPLHPPRSFRGREQVRRNWTQIFAFVPDLHAEVVRCAFDGDTAWTEWEMTGTRARRHRASDARRHRVRRGRRRRAWARFYLEPVVDDAGTVDDAVRQQVVR